MPSGSGTEVPLKPTALRPLIALLLLGVLAAACTPDRHALVRVGIVLSGEGRRPQVEGFTAGMTELGYRAGRDVDYLIYDAHHDAGRLPELVRRLIAAKVDLLVAAGGLEADAMKTLAAPRGIPVVVLYANAILERGLVQRRDRPGWNVTGVDNLNAELSGKRLALLHDLLPKARRILVLYSADIAPSTRGLAVARAAAASKGLHVVGREVRSRADLRAVMQALQPGEFDAMLTVPNARVANAFETVVQPELKRLHLPVMAHSRAFTEMGALASYGADFYQLGRQAARLADKVLSGMSPQRMPFETPQRLMYTVNREVQRRLGLRLTDLARNQINTFVPARP